MDIRVNVYPEVCYLIIIDPGHIIAFFIMCSYAVFLL